MTRHPRARLAGPGRRLAHAVAIVAGWGLFAWSWWRVSLRPWESGSLVELLVAASLLIPLATIAWIVHNVGIFRRRGPRRAVNTTPSRYEIDFHGRRIEADWPGLQQAAVVVIECDAQVKHYRAAAPSREPA